MGTLFGIYSQVALAVLALGLLVVSIAGLWMWWIKPRRNLPELKITPAVLAGVVAYSIIAPLFGASLVIFFLGDWIVRRVRAPQRGWNAAAGESTLRPQGEFSSRSLSTVRNG